MAKRVVLVAAVARNGVIGNEGSIPWHLPEDLRHFRRVTEGNVVVMGRKTFDSLGRPLPRRANIVVTRQPDWEHEGVYVAPSVEDALGMAAVFDGDVMVIGGGEIYAAALPSASEQILTEVDLSPEGDAFYPAFDEAEWAELSREPHPESDPPYAIVRWGRIFLG